MSEACVNETRLLGRVLGREGNDGSKEGQSSSQVKPKLVKAAATITLGA